MQSVGIYTTGKNFTGSGRYRIVSTCQTGDRIQQDHHIMSAFHHSFGFFQNDIGHLDVSFCRFVESRRNDFGSYAPCHVCYFLRTFIDQQDDQINFGVIRSDRVGNLFQQYGFTGFRLSDDQTALSFTDRSEHIYNSGRNGSFSITGNIEFLIRKQRSQVIERNTIPDCIGSFPVYFFHLDQRKILLSFFRRPYRSFYGISGLQTEQLDLALRNIDIIGRVKVIVIRGTQKAISIGHNFQYTRIQNNTFEFIIFIALIEPHPVRISISVSISNRRFLTVFLIPVFLYFY